MSNNVIDINVKGDHINANDSGYDKTNQNLKEYNETLDQYPIIDQQNQKWGDNVDDEQISKEAKIGGFIQHMYEVPENEKVL
jgi:hypothetical protein